MSDPIRRFFRSFAEDTTCAILLEGMPMLGGTVGENPRVNRWSIMGFRPRQRIRLEGGTLWVNDRPEPVSSRDQLFERLRRLQAACRVDEAGPPDLPFRGGLMGFFGYEFVRWCEPALASHFPRPDACWPEAVLCEFSDVVIADRARNAIHVLSDDPFRRRVYETGWQELAGEVALMPPTFTEASADYAQGFAPSLTPAQFEAAVETLRRAIAEGALYQGNLSLQLKKRLKIDPYALFDGFSRRNPSPFSALFQWPGGMILSNSPERLVSVDGAGQVESRPIAGTRGRGKTPDEDAAVGQTLLENEKERAEHLMLVDLERNDLGRVCVPGSVEVNELLTIERYSHVTHLVSNVTGRLAGGRDAWDVLQAVFPGGTITGCPKIRCMELLNGLEPVSRGAYTGSLGYLDAASGRMDLNILIRSLFLKETGTPFVYNGAIHVGAGIVADSVGAWEYRECQRKAAAILGVLQAYEQRTEHALQ